MNRDIRQLAHPSINERLSGLPTRVYIISILTLVAILVFSIGEFGESWDVGAQEYMGGKAYTYYFNGFDNLQFRTNNSDMHYGPLFEVFVRIVQSSASGLVAKHEIRVLLQALISFSCLVPVFLISARVVPKPLALISVALVAATPDFFGHAFINPKDNIFASGYLWALFYIFFYLLGDRKAGYGAFIFIGILIGIVSSLRYMAAYLLLIIFIGVILLPALRSRDANASSLFSRLLHHTMLHYRRLIALLLAFAIAYTLSMPAILTDFSARSYVDVLRKFAHYPWGNTNLYFGNYVPADQLPWHYIYGYMFVKLPLYYHVFLLSILLTSITRPGVTFKQLHKFLLRDCQASSIVILLLASLTIPLILILTMRPVLYDAFRHGLFMVPLVSMLFFFGFLGTMTQAQNLTRGALVMIVTLCWTEAVLAMRWLHPYEYVYYNPLMNPVGSFEGEYWATSFREVAKHLNHYARQTQRGEKLRLLVCGPHSSLTRFLEPGKFEVVKPGTRDEPHLVVALNRWDCMAHLKEPWLFSVNRGNWVFAAVSRS